MNGRKDRINSIIGEMDSLIENRDRKYRIIEKEYPGGESGQIASKYHAEYSRRKREAEETFNKDFLELLDLLTKTCKRERERQPHFKDLSSKTLNTSGRIPKEIIQGRICVDYPGFEDEYVPHMLPFPIKKPVKLSSGESAQTVFSIILRLLYTLPVGKTEVYAFDPNFFGGTFQHYNRLFSDRGASPMGKVCSTRDELVSILKLMTLSAENLIQRVFTPKYDNWSRYNRAVRKGEISGSIIPYKVLYLCDVPDQMNEECVDLLSRLSNVSEKCGIFIAMTVNDKRVENIPQERLDETTRKVIELLDKCPDLTDVLNDAPELKDVKHLHLSYVSEDFPGADVFDSLILDYLEKVEQEKERGSGFFDLFNSADVFSECSHKSVDAVLGVRADNGAEAVLSIGNDTPHILIGGSTGSGKSNLLHVMISNLCRRYSPDELELYLLDFKEGVEFASYAFPKQLPQAKLIATEADVEFGLGVLDHICEEMSKRYGIFKENNLKDYIAYRSKYPEEKMPRMILLIDEFQVMFMDKELSPEILRRFTDIVKQGRAAGIHLVMATQTLNGLSASGNSFSAIAPQFSGRVALKCSASESSDLLGASAGSNSDAASLKIPYAIMNTQNGLAEYNIKFAAPNADGCVLSAVETLNSEWYSRGGGFFAKIFTGDELPKHPDKSRFESEGCKIFIGEVYSYDNEIFSVDLTDMAGENLLICGMEPRILSGLKKSVMLSAYGSGGINEIVTVGGDFSEYSEQGKPTRNFAGLKELVAFLKENESDKKRLLIFDNADPFGEIGYTTESYPACTTEEGKFLVEYLKTLNRGGSHLIAFFDTSNSYESSKIGKIFSHIVCFELTFKQMSKLLSNFPPASDGFMPHGRAFVFRSDVRDKIIKPFADS